ncbi:MAG: hypothetical protein HYW24_00605 [Candidatus Aenigmarchaeota archaeon]|nr:hypothetical protein [Candidatus Aenigmarchaeota archaeon]
MRTHSIGLTGGVCKEQGPIRRTISQQNDDSKLFCYHLVSNCCIKFIKHHPILMTFAY